MSIEKQRRLGRGLEALISAATAPSNVAAPGSDLQRIPVSRIRPNPFQPRRTFDPRELADLEASIRASGLLQPITVRRKGDAFELVAGERRLRAVTNLGWSEVPAIVRDLDDQTLLVLALVENLQRADLNPIEEARGYQRLLEEFQLTQQQVADAVGKDRATVANFLRLLALPEPVRRMVEEGVVSAGHARAILSLGKERAMLELANEVVAKGLSVRETETRARTRAPERTTPRPGPKRSEGAPLPPAVRASQEALRRHLQTDVEISLTSADRGSLRIAFYSAEDYDRILDLILGARREAY